MTSQQKWGERCQALECGRARYLPSLIALLAPCTDVSATTTLERPISSLGPALNYQASALMSETQSRYSGTMPLED